MKTKGIMCTRDSDMHCASEFRYKKYNHESAICALTRWIRMKLGNKTCALQAISSTLGTFLCAHLTNDVILLKLVRISLYPISTHMVP
jgi:hypothetical protein